MSIFCTDEEDARFDAFSICDDYEDGDEEDICHACNGSGEAQFDEQICPVCKGK